jgi:hypothetical protein
LTVAYAWPLFRIFGSHLPADSIDPGLNTWILWWNTQALPLTERWWNAPMFHPAPGMLSLSETLLSLAPLTTPLQWMGASPVVAYNVAFLLSFPAAALAAHALAHRLTGRHDAALLAGLAFGFSPYRAAQLPHLQTLWSCWMPLCLLALHKYLDSGRRRLLVAAGVCWALNALTTGYFLMYFSVLLGFWILWFARSWRQWLPIVGTLALAAAAVAPVLVGYWQHQQALGVARNFGEISQFSADASAIWASGNVWPASYWTLQPRSEGELYPGVVVLGLSLAGAIAAWRATRVRWPRWRLVTALLGGYLAEVVLLTMMLGPWAISIFGWRVSLTRPGKPLFIATTLLLIACVADPRIRQAWRRHSVLLFYAVAAAVMFIFAMGPTAYAFGEVFWPRAPYLWLMEYVPGGRSLRVPARFAMLVVLCLAQAAAVAFARLAKDRPAWKWAAIAFAAAIALDGWVPAMRMTVAAAPLTLPADAAAAPAAIVELPIGNTVAEAAALLRSIGHQQPLVNGFSGYSPPHYFALREAFAARDGRVVETLRHFGPLVALVHRQRDAAGETEAFVRSQPEVESVGETDLGPLFRWSQRAVTLPSGTAVPVASISTAVNSHLVPLITDGQPDTAWQSGPGAVGTTLELVLDSPRSLSALELDLGPYHLDFPRDLQIEVGDRTRGLRRVWQGDTGGLAAFGILTDRRRSPIVIPLPEDAVGDVVVLTLRRADGFEQWSVTGLRLFARPGT